MVCKRCQIDKPESEYRPSTLNPLWSGKKWCRSCISSYEREGWKKHREANGQIHAERLASRRVYHARNREHHAKLMKQHYQTNIKMYDYWRSKSLARARGATQFLTLEQWEILRSHTHCYWCGMLLTPAIINVDHVVPICEGGQHTFENLALSCANCNLGREWERKVLEWRLPEVPESESNRKDTNE